MNRPRTLVDVAGRHAATRADHPAMLCEGRRVDYATLSRHSKQVAAGIRALGLRPGDRLAFLGKESECYYELLFGVARSGAVLVPINWRLAAAEVEHVLTDSGAAVLFVDHESAALAERVVAGLPGAVRVIRLDQDGDPVGGFAAWRDRHPAAELPHRAEPDDAVVQMYTSGTTGLPKGVVLAHRTFFAVPDGLAEAGLDWIDWHPADRSLVALPGFHIGGLWWAVQGLAAGITNVLMRAFLPGAAVELITTLGTTTAGLVPSMMRQLLAQPGVTADDFASLRKVAYGGSPISDSLLSECVTVFGCDFVQFYGLTESGNTSLCLPPEDHVVGSPRMQAAGRPYPGIEVRVRDRAGNDLPPGEIGEICLRTPAVMLGYWRRPDATAAALRDGWLHTGDAGHLDADGYVYISDRIKDMVIVDGENVYPAEVENALCAHPAVADAAVVGVPDDRWGEAVHAFVVPAQGCDVRAADLTSFLSDRLAPFKMPLRYDPIETIPRNPSGKILRRTLREPFWTGRARAVN